MNCQEAQNLIDGYLDAEIDLLKSLEIERHLQECPSCSQSYENRQALQRGIRSGSLYFKAPAELQERVQLALHKTARPRSRVVPARWFGVSASVAAAAVLLLIILPFFLRGPSNDDVLVREVISSHVRSLMPNHLADVASSDEHTVKPWFDGKLDFSPPVEDLADRGFPLIGGRLDYLDRRPVAALVYQSKKHFINLFIWPATGTGKSAVKTLTRQGYHLSHWTESGMNFWAVSDVEEKQFQQFVQLVQQGTAPKS
jgi:anti-sigma factor RsiW